MTSKGQAMSDQSNKPNVFLKTIRSAVDTIGELSVTARKTIVDSVAASERAISEIVRDANVNFVHPEFGSFWSGEGKSLVGEAQQEGAALLANVLFNQLEESTISDEARVEIVQMLNELGFHQKQEPEMQEVPLIGYADINGDVYTVCLSDEDAFDYVVKKNGNAINELMDAEDIIIWAIEKWAAAERRINNPIQVAETEGVEGSLVGKSIYLEKVVCDKITGDCYEYQEGMELSENHEIIECYVAR
jgi:hypothetical protein